MIAENMEIVRNNIVRTCIACGRDPEEVKLIAVSKTKPNEAVMEAYGLGQRAFGENYVQELTRKFDELPKDIEWHMIGHLQRNKVKYVVGRAALIHSVDSFRLAQEINERSQKLGLVTGILAEVNVAGEENKYGFTPDETCSFAQQVSELKNIELTGLMTSAPIVTDPEENRIFFKI